MTNETPLVTIITVTFNAELFLETTVQSIIEQNYPNIEYIIIDGGSTDTTIDIIKKYKKHINYWISEPDQGIYDAMNKGIHTTSGKWVNFMNAGDTFTSPNSISNIFDKLQHNTDIVCGDVFLVDQQKKTKYYQKSSGFNDISNSMIPCNHQGMFVKASIMKAELFNTHYLLAADYDFIIKIFTKNKNFQFINEATSNFLLGGETQKNNLLLRIESLHIQAKYELNTLKLSDNYHFQSLLKIYAKKNNNNTISKSLEQSFSKSFSTLYNHINQLKSSDDKLIIYGAGSVLETFYESLKHKIIDIIDCAKSGKKIGLHTISSPSKLNHYPSETKILITVLGRENEIEDYLLKEFNISNKSVIRLKLY